MSIAVINMDVWQSPLWLTHIPSGTCQIEISTALRYSFLCCLCLLHFLLCFQEHFTKFSLVIALNFIPLKGILLLWDIVKICISIFFLRYVLVLKWDGMHMWFSCVSSFIAMDIKHFLTHLLASCTSALRIGSLFRNESTDYIPWIKISISFISDLC
jgi:hypothetical protein